MEKTLLTALGITLLAVSAQAEPTVKQQSLPENFDAWNLNFRPPEVPENHVTIQPREKKASRLKNRANASEKTVTLTVAAQTYHKNYSFSYNGGAATTYSINVVRNGDKVTISNFFNLEAQSTEWSKGVDFDVTGTYDEIAGTITIPTLQDLETGTQVGTIADYYTCVLVSGTVTTTGQLEPADALVLNVTGDFEEITSSQDFGIMNYTPDGYTMGMQTLYRRFNAVLPKAEPRLIAFNNFFDLGETYPKLEASTSMSIVNVSNSDVDFAISMESEGNAFSVTPQVGSIAGGSIQDLTFTFVPPIEGEFEGLATIAYDGVNSTPSPLEVLLTGKAIATPDFSSIVDKGNFSFMTNIEFPFFLTTLSDGTAAAQSGTKGQYGTSKLTASFTVPEGNIGVLKWKSNFTNEGQWYENAGGLFSDDAPTAWLSTNVTGDLSGSYEYAPGDHSMRWQYESQRYTGNENNMMTVSHLELICTEAKANDLKLVTENVDLGNFMLDGTNPIEAYGTITIRNYGTNPLKVNNVTSDNNAFTATRATTEAPLLGELTIPVTFNGSEAGSYEGNIKISTSAGDVTAHVKALVRRMADFSSLIKEGAELVTAYSTDPSYPFEMSDGVAYNTTSGESDDQATTSWFKINFTVPEGKAVYMEWDGHLYGSQPDPEMYWVGDYAGFDYTHPMSSGTPIIYGTDIDAGSEATMNADEFWKQYLICIPGEHSLKFMYMKNGDGIISEKDRLEISAIRLRLIDFKERDVEASVSEINFDKTYVGENRYLTATVTLKNTGSQPLEIYDEIDSQAPFYGVVPENRYPVQFPQTMDVAVWFYPSEEGNFEGTVTFKTSAGDVVIKCTGSTESSEGVILIGDIEDAANGWTFYDADNDRDCWNLGYNLWGNYPEWCHSGSDCFGSPSWSPIYGAIEPDNWLFSPTVKIPEDGAMLRWYAAAHHSERYAENYSVYICTPEEIEDPEALRLLTPYLTETLPEEAHDNWIEHVADLSDYAGKDVNIAFRHHNCNGQYVLKLDDIFVYTKQRWDEMSGVEAVEFAPATVSTEIYNISGIRLDQLTPGINIVRITDANGRTQTRKIIVK